MGHAPETNQWTGSLPRLPIAVKTTITAFLALTGTGYLVAIANIRHSHQLADGREGMSLDDVRAVYSGMKVPRGGAVPSRMLTMIRTEMRQYFQSEADFETLENWLTAGGSEAGLDEGQGRRTPRRVILRTCLECHAQSAGTEISKHAPFGPNEFEVDYAMLAPLASGGSTEHDAPATGSHAEPDETVEVPPQYTVKRLVLVSHIHMLTIPMFTLMVGFLFSLTRLPAGLRGALTPVPMIALVFDFAGWWLARALGAFVYVLVATGAVFGLVFAIQLVAVAVDLWRPYAGRK